MTGIRLVAYAVNVLAVLWNTGWMAYYTDQGQWGWVVFHASFWLLAVITLAFLFSTEGE